MLRKRFLSQRYGYTKKNKYKGLKLFLRKLVLYRNLSEYASVIVSLLRYNLKLNIQGYGNCLDRRRKQKLKVRSCYVMLRRNR